MSFCSGLEHSCSPAAFLRLSSTDYLEQNSSSFRGRGLWSWWLFYALQDVEQHPWSILNRCLQHSLTCVNQKGCRGCQMPPLTSTLNTQGPTRNPGSYIQSSREPQSRWKKWRRKKKWKEESLDKSKRH